ncbi:hypothetical protein FML69_19960 [Raoultella ornithinolytica]|nr:hypothetical protein [Raoultella ornithinolytica]
MFKLFLFTRFAGQRTSPASKEIIHVMGIWRKHCDEYWVGERKYKACRGGRPERITADGFRRRGRFLCGCGR